MKKILFLCLLFVFSCTKEKDRSDEYVKQIGELKGIIQDLKKEVNKNAEQLKNKEQLYCSRT